MKKEKYFWIMVAVVVTVEFCLGILLVKQMYDIRSILQDGSMRIAGAPVDGGATYMEAEAPSSYCDSSLEFAGKDTISVKAGTIDCKISLTSAEFRESAAVRVKVDGKSYKLQRKDNRFTGTFPVSLFKSVEPEVILEDGEIIKTEYPDSLSAFLSTDFDWVATGAGPNETKKGLGFDLTVTYCGEEMPNNAQLTAVSEGKTIYTKDVTVEDTSEDCDQGFFWKETLPVKKGKTVDLYVQWEGKEGFQFRYKLGTSGNGSDFYGVAGQTREILSPDGTVLLMENVQEEE